VLPLRRKILVTIGWTFWLPAAPPPSDPPIAVGLNSFGGRTTASPRTVVVSTVCWTGAVSSVRAGGLVCAACSAGDLIWEASSRAAAAATTTSATTPSRMIRRRRRRS
jgi:hypothetical protein